jgi:hypothetical protein
MKLLGCVGRSSRTRANPPQTPLAPHTLSRKGAVLTPTNLREADKGLLIPNYDITPDQHLGSAAKCRPVQSCDQGLAHRPPRDAPEAVRVLEHRVCSRRSIRIAGVVEPAFEVLAGTERPAVVVGAGSAWAVRSAGEEDDRSPSSGKGLCRVRVATVLPRTHRPVPVKMHTQSEGVSSNQSRTLHMSASTCVQRTNSLSSRRASDRRPGDLDWPQQSSRSAPRAGSAGPAASCPVAR